MTDLENPELTFIHISDTHIGADPSYIHRGFAPFERASLLVADIERLGVTPDFVMHTGDVCGDKQTHATPAHYRLANTLLARLPKPRFYCVGNHDCAKSMFSSLEMGEHTAFFQNGEDFAYSFSAKGVLCLSLSSSVATQRAGVIGASQRDALADRLRDASSPVLLFLHHPSLSMGSPWMDQNMLLTDGEEFHRLITQYKEKVLGVFCGHIHQPWHTVKDGVNYFSSPGTIFQFSTLPSDVTNQVEPEGIVSYSIVRVRAGQLQVNLRTVPTSQRRAAE